MDSESRQNRIVEFARTRGRVDVALTLAEDDLVAVLVEKVFVSTSNSDKCDQRENGTKSKLDKARHIQ